MLSRKHFFGFFAATLLTLSACVATSPTPRERSAHYIDTSAFVLQQIVPPPPANDSVETRAELDEMLRIQEARSAEAAARAKADAAVTVFRFSEALGSNRFAEANLPLTTAFFEKIENDEGIAVGPAKDAFARPRPFLLEGRLQPLLDKPKSWSYPSGHSTYAYCVGLVLADMVPEKRAEIMARAREYAHNRVVVGVHFPSDIEAGAMSGAALATMLFSSPKFRADQAVATKELRQVLGLPARP